MLGLIYKDVAAHRYLLFFQAGFVLMLSYVMFTAEVPAMAAPVMMIMLYIGGSIIPETAMQTDIAVRWNVFALTLPTATRKTVLAKFLLMAGMYLICFLCSIILMAIFSNVHEIKFDIIPLITIFAIVVGFDSITYALVFRFGHKRGVTFKALGVFAVPMLGVLYLFFGDLTVFGENGIGDFLDWLITFDYSNLFNVVCLPVVILGVVLFGLCYWLSCKGYRKGLEVGEE